MRDPEARLEEALRGIGDDYLRRHPPDLVRARTTVGRIRRRRQVRAGALSALGAAAAIAVAVYAWPGADVAGDRSRVAGRIELPNGSVSIPVEEAPTEVAVGDDAIWVSNSGSESVSRIDPVTDAVVSTVQLNGEPGDLAIGAGGEVWVTIPELGIVRRIDSTSNGFTPDVRVDIADPHTPLDLAIDDHLWVTAVGGDLVQIDPVGGEVVRRIPGLDPVNVAAREGAVLVLGSDGTVRGIDPATGTPNAIELSFDVSGRGDVHYYEGVVWVAAGDGNALYSADLGAASEAIQTFPFRGEYVEMVHVDEGVLVLSEIGSGRGLLSFIPETGAAVELHELPDAPRDLVRGHGDLWVSSSAAGAVTRLGDVDLGS